MMLENKKVHNQQWWPSQIINRVNGHNFEIGLHNDKVKFGLIPSSVSLIKKIFKDFQFFKPMTTILDIGQGHQTQFQKRNIQDWFNLAQRNKIQKVNGRQKPNVGGKKSTKNVYTKIKHFSLVVVQHLSREVIQIYLSATVLHNASFILWQYVYPNIKVCKPSFSE